MEYCLMNLRPALEGHGKEPDFPEEMGYLLLADCHSSEWGLYEFSRDETTDAWKPKNPVSAELEALIDSGKRFPPALALTRDKISLKFQTHKPSLVEFSDALIKSLRHNLSVQQDAGFILAPSVQDEIGYLNKSEWYWLLKITENDPDIVSWVSDDYFIYHNAITDFNLTEKQLKNLKKKELSNQPINSDRKTSAV